MRLFIVSSIPLVIVLATFACSRSSGQGGGPTNGGDKPDSATSTPSCEENNTCAKPNDGGDGSEVAFDETKPVFDVTPVDLAGSDGGPQPADDAGSAVRLGALVCDPTGQAGTDPVYGMFCFQTFGIDVDIPNHPKMKNPTFSYVIAQDAVVRSILSGNVTAMIPKTDPWDGPNEFTVFVSPSANSAYAVEYDHLKDPPFQVGAHVSAGDIIGKGGRCQGCDYAYAFLEVGLHYHMSAKDGSSTNLCPVALGSASFRSAHEAALTTQSAVFPASHWNASKVCVVDHDP